MTTNAQATASPALLPIPEVCRRLGISRSYAYVMMDAGRLRFVKLGKRRLVPPAAIDELVRELEQQAAERSGAVRRKVERKRRGAFERQGQRSTAAAAV